jgi:hypothetical protein
MAAGEGDLEHGEFTTKSAECDRRVWQKRSVAGTAEGEGESRARVQGFFLVISYFE